MGYGVPLALHRAGLLKTFYTDFYAGDFLFRMLSCIPARLRPDALHRICGRRTELPGERLRAFQSFGLRYALKRRLARSASAATEAYLWAGERFGDLILRDGLNGASAVYGFNSASEKLFEGARRRGIRAVLEQTIVPWAVETRLLASEAQRWPGWEGPAGDEASAAYAAREQREAELADLIVCGSQYVAAALAEQGVPADKCRVVAYGIDRAWLGVGANGRRRGHQPLRVLFVGSVGLRKGVPYLLQAAGAFSRREVVVRIVGPLKCDRRALACDLPDNVEVPGPVPHSRVRQEYEWADVFCLPSICEGSATVVYEALAAGLPVVTTPNAGSIVQDGVEGYIVPAGDVEALRHRIHQLATDGKLLQDMSQAALLRSEYGSEQAYGRRLVAAMQDVLKGAPSGATR